MKEKRRMIEINKTELIFLKGKENGQYLSKPIKNKREDSNK